MYGIDCELFLKIFFIFQKLSQETVKKITSAMYLKFFLDDNRSNKHKLCM